MTTGAVRIDRLKGTADVTTFAAYVRMAAVEHKPRAEVVKRLLRPGSAGQRHADRCRNENQAPEQQQWLQR